MKVITAPEPLDRTGVPTQVRVFLAGGITGCSDWQTKLISQLRGEPLLIMNPRRPAFDVRDKSASEAQITWEFNALRFADVITFWFPDESLCPITLYELGAMSMTAKPLIIAAHPGYPRRLDVVEQTKLARPGLEVGDSLAYIVEALRCL